MQLPERAARAAEPAKKSLPFFGSTEYGDMHHDGFKLDDDTGDMAGYKRAPEDTGAFEGRTEAQMAYVAHPLEQGRKATGAKSHGIGVGEGAFKGSTESREAFPGHVVRAAGACRRTAEPALGLRSVVVALVGCDACVLGCLCMVPVYGACADSHPRPRLGLR